ncbi:MAG: ATP-binding protein [Chloroflexi bacterium]|nr:ATP-binding protein [Chloroflexota bacterium]
MNEDPNSGEPSAGSDAAVLRHALRHEIRQVAPMPGQGALVALCGLPGTGKSHFAAALKRRTPCVVLGSDRMRKTLVSQPRYTRQEHARVFRAAHLLVEALLEEGFPVVFDATNLTARARDPLRDIASRAGAPLVLVQFDAPPQLVRQRLARRSRGQASDSYSDADWRIYCRLYPGQEPVSAPHLDVDSSKDTGTVVEEVARLLEERAR